MLEAVGRGDARDLRRHREGDLIGRLDAVLGNLDALCGCDHNGVLRVDVDVVEPVSVGVRGVGRVVRERNRHEEGRGLLFDGARGVGLTYEVSLDRQIADRRQALAVRGTADLAGVERSSRAAGQRELRRVEVRAAGVGGNVPILEVVPVRLGLQVEVGNREGREGDSRDAGASLSVGLAVGGAVGLLRAGLVFVNDNRSGGVGIDVALVGEGRACACEAGDAQSQRSDHGTRTPPGGLSVCAHLVVFLF